MNTCPDCRTRIPAGQAVIRSISFERVALCQPCAKDRGWLRIPSPRESVEGSERVIR